MQLSLQLLLVAIWGLQVAAVARWRGNRARSGGGSRGWSGSSGGTYSGTAGAWAASFGRGSSSSSFCPTTPRPNPNVKRPDPTLKWMRESESSTWSGTKFSSPQSLDSKLESEYTYRKKQVGIGAAAGFVGGSGYTYLAGLVTYSLYHRYQRYRWYRHITYHDIHDEDFDEDYFTTYYQRNDCQDGCPSNTHCEWGLCECGINDNSNYKKNKMWGRCLQAGQSVRDAPEPGDRAEGGACTTTADCTGTDINMVCSTREASCKCRRDTRWNVRTLECQLYIDVDCSPVLYTSQVSPRVQAAADSIQHQLRGWTTEQDKKKKILQLPEVRKAVARMLSAKPTNVRRRVGSSGIDSDEQLLDSEHSKEEGEEGEESEGSADSSSEIVTWVQPNIDTFCNNGICSLAGINCREEDLVVLLAPSVDLEYERNANRTKTPSEALESSLLAILTSNTTNTSTTSSITRKELDEAFCRDTETFSKLFKFEAYRHRKIPQPKEVVGSECQQPLTITTCAVLYDSSSCAPGTWKLTVPTGTQRDLSYWSSDWKYRNDADILDVRAGCSFTGWAGNGFTGDSFTLTAGAEDRSVLLSDSKPFKRFDESILSFQCNCRG